MAIDLLSLKPHAVSTDLGGYITFLYGAPKTGKTTLATQMPGALLLAFEKGYNALPGVIAQDILTWAEMKQVYRELKNPEVKERFKSIVVDTVDVAAALCEKYICNQNGIDELGQLGYGKGWSAFRKEMEETFRGLTQMGYAVVFISHEKEFTDEKEKITYIRPSLSTTSRSIVENLADIYGYAKAFPGAGADGKSAVKLLLRSDDGRISCGCRFKYIEPVIDFNYNSLAAAIKEAIEKEAAMHGNQFVTDKREEAPVAMTYNYDALKDEFETIVGGLMNKNAEHYAPRVTEIVEKYLGKGKKVAETTRAQAEFIYLIVQEIKDTLIEN